MLKSGGPGSEAERLEEESDAAFERAAVAPDPNVKAIEFAEGLARAREAELAAAYTYLQRAVGVLAVSLPAMLVAGHRILNGDEWVRGSISSYYYTHMGNVFVGVLCALAVFFLSYNYRPIRSFEFDNLLSTFASAAAAGVAIFPTAGRAIAASTGERVVSALHLLCAGALFVLLGVFAMFRFTKTNPDGDMTPEKVMRNRVYRVCGTLIFGAIGLVIVTLAVKPPAAWHTLFWLETVCVEAFGVSWLVKGGFLGILADKEPESSTLRG